MARPKKCIEPQDAEKLFTHWCNTRGEALRNHLGEHDTCEFTLSISEIREYLDYVESESKKMGISNPGVRLYFGAYDNDNDDNDQNRDDDDNKPNKATFFLAPTLGEDSKDENNYKIDPWNKHQGGWPPFIYNP